MTDPLIPPAWQAVDRLFDEIVPASHRWQLDEAIANLVAEAETIAVKRHGQIILTAIFGDQFQQMSELCEDR